MRLLLATLLALSLSGCGALYTNIRMPRAWRTATPEDVKGQPSDPLVEGRSCARAVLWIVVWGDEGYAAAARDALKGQPENAILYDVRSDMKVFSVLAGVYAEICTVVTGRVARI